MTSPIEPIEPSSFDDNQQYGWKNRVLGDDEVVPILVIKAANADIVDFGVLSLSRVIFRKRYRKGHT
jgi:hypothetical protein